MNEKKLIEQEPEFKEFLAECLVAWISGAHQTKGMISSIYGFWQLGMSKEDVAKWMIIVANSTEDKGKDKD